MTGDSAYRIAGLMLGGAVLAATLAGCGAGPATAGPDERSVPTGTTSASAAVGPTASQQKVPTGDPRNGTGSRVPGRNQAFMLQAVDRAEDPVLTVTASGRIGTYPGGADTGEREQFVLSPLAPGAMSYLLKTAKLRTGGEPHCVGADADTLRTMACDAADSRQSVVFAAPKGAGGPIGKTFDLIIGGFDVEVAADGTLSLRKRGDGYARTTFRFILAGTVGEWP
jgi:hypothetical protein